tara:strand:+ start:13985 stop:15409 length:1425 start_codon:yes stop_codon:yes gene_type:complete
MSGYKVKKVCCIGAGYVGGPTMIVFANKCPHIQFKVVDLNTSRIDAWNNEDLKKLPIYEPGLEKLLIKCRNNNLFFLTDIQSSIEEADMVFISVNTPTKEKGVGAGKASDLKWIEASARQIAEYSKGHTIVVEKSTLPVRTAETIKKILDSSYKKNSEDQTSKTFSVLSNPEFLSEGNAIKDLESPDRVLIGGESENAMDALENLYINWITKEKILRTNLWSSELSKLAANAFLAQRISSINSISAICEETGADIEQVSNAIGTDSRIGNKFLNPSPGFGGSCFQKDILNLIYLCEFYKLENVANYWQSVLNINNWQKLRISKLVVNKLFGNVSGKKISILGFAFKANTNDTRNSPSIDICNDLLEEGAYLSIYDPKVDKDQICRDLCSDSFSNNQNYKNDSWEFCNSIEDSALDSHAVLVLTEWEQFKNIDWYKLSALMRKPSWVFDTRLCIDSKDVLEAGFNYWRLGLNNRF